MFQCNWTTCNKSFARKSDLQRHYRIHIDERPYSCGIPGCGKRFIQRSALTIHIRTHTGEKPHRCQHVGCGKRFSDSSSLARHRHMHSGQRPNECTYDGCSRSFRRKTSMIKHHRQVHQQKSHYTNKGSYAAEPETGESPPTPSQTTRHQPVHETLTTQNRQQAYDYGIHFSTSFAEYDTNTSNDDLQHFGYCGRISAEVKKYNRVTPQQHARSQPAQSMTQQSFFVNGQRISTNFTTYGNGHACQAARGRVYRHASEIQSTADDTTSSFTDSPGLACFSGNGLAVQERLYSCGPQAASNAPQSTNAVEMCSLMLYAADIPPLSQQLCTTDDMPEHGGHPLETVPALWCQCAQPMELVTIGQLATYDTAFQELYAAQIIEHDSPFAQMSDGWIGSI